MFSRITQPFLWWQRHRARAGLCATLLVATLPGTGCREINSLFFATMSEPDPCDAGANVYRGETHFIERDFLHEDGTIDYDKWLRITDPGLSPCDPLNTRKAELER